MSEENTEQTESSWKDGLSDELKVNPTIAQTESVSSLANQLVDAQAYMGQSLRLPTEESTPEAWNEFNAKLIEKVPGVIKKPGVDDEAGLNQLYDSLGRPEAPDKYIPLELEMPEGVQLNDEPVEAFRKIAHDSGLSQTQFQEIVNKMRLDGVRETEKGIQAHNEAHRGLQKEWGLASDDRMGVAEKARSEFFPHLQELSQLPAETVKSLFTLGNQLGGEATGLSADLGVQTPGRLSPQEAQMRLAEIGTDRNHPYWQANDPAHALWGGESGKYVALMKQAYPEGS